jgi:hypothetical protein
MLPSGVACTGSRDDERRVGDAGMWDPSGVACKGSCDDDRRVGDAGMWDCTTEVLADMGCARTGERDRAMGT